VQRAYSNNDERCVLRVLPVIVIDFENLYTESEASRDLLVECDNKYNAYIECVASKVASNGESRPDCEEIAKDYEECRRKFVEQAVICGTYNPEDNSIIVFARCIAVSAGLKPSKEQLVQRFIQVVAHELIHYAQYNGLRRLLGVEIREDMNSERHEKYLKLPYRMRPHEIEAYEKMDYVAKRIEECGIEDILNLAAWFAYEMCNRLNALSPRPMCSEE